MMKMFKENCSCYGALRRKWTMKMTEIVSGKSEISLPNELLEAANIPLDSDIEIVCTEGAIIITEVDLLDMIPDELCQLFAELNISPETVRSVIRSGGVLNEQ